MTDFDEERMNWTGRGNGLHRRIVDLGAASLSLLRVEGVLD